MLNELKYFSYDEFDSPDARGTGYNMDAEFLKMLVTAREKAGIPFKITSGYRTEAHNKKVGGVANSSHLRGYAADISAKDSPTRFKIVSALLEAGFSRVGIASSFVHVDNDPDKAKGVIWTY